MLLAVLFLTVNNDIYPRLLVADALKHNNSTQVKLAAVKYQFHRTVAINGSLNHSKIEITQTPSWPLTQDLL
jgi:hypothetical protein